MNQTNSPLLGILGGLGPMSTVYFYELLTRHTNAQKDSDHIDLIISSRASTPDRTDFILQKSKNDPLDIMAQEVHRLEQAGAKLIVIPCNTAHYFYDGLTQKCKVPMLNIIEETVKHLHQRGISTFGLLATEGTIASGAYTRVCERFGMQCITPTKEEQAVITSIIYEQIKQNKPADINSLLCVANALLSRGCQRLVLGCTELSLLKKEGLSDNLFTDSLEVLAYQTILACGKEPIGFPPSFLKGGMI